MAEMTRTGFVWHELMTTDVEGARAFCREVAGLATSASGDYEMLMDGERAVGGLVGPTPQGPTWPSGGPEAHWVAYIGVADVDAAVERARALGAQVLVSPVDVPGWGRVAVLRDPQGAAFGLFAVAP